MKGFVQDIEQLTLHNSNFRHVLYTGKYSQLVVMNLKPGEEIGFEVHDDTDQFFRFDKGHGTCIIDGQEHHIQDGFAVIVPAGARHNIINTSDSEPLQFYTIYSPAHHQDGTIHVTKAQAEADDEEFDGRTSE